MYAIRTIDGATLRRAKDAARQRGESLDDVMARLISAYADNRVRFNIQSDSEVVMTCGASRESANATPDR